MFIMFVKSTYFGRNSDKSLLSPERNNLLRNLRHDFLDERQLKIIVPKYAFPEYAL